MADGKTKGADLRSKMYEMAPKDLAEEVVSLMYDDGRSSSYPGGDIGCPESSCRYATSMQLEMLSAMYTLRRLCAEGAVWRVAVVEALASAPAALDTLLAMIVSCPYIGPMGVDDAGDGAGTG